MKPIQWAFVATAAFVAARAVIILPREEAIKREMCEQGKFYGIDWQWKQPADWRERFFGLQQAEYLR